MSSWKVAKVVSFQTNGVPFWNILQWKYSKQPFFLPVFSDKSLRIQEQVSCPFLIEAEPTEKPGGRYPDDRAPYTCLQYVAKKNNTNTMMEAHQVKFNRVNSYVYVKGVQKH